MGAASASRDQLSGCAPFMALIHVQQNALKVVADAIARLETKVASQWDPHSNVRVEAKWVSNLIREERLSDQEDCVLGAGAEHAEAMGQ